MSKKSEKSRDNKGLTEKEAEKRLGKYGQNKIERKEEVKWWKILLSQFKSPLILILVVAAILLGLVTGFTDQSNLLDIGLILIIVLASGLAGFFQDWKAERSIEALQKMAEPKALVIRDGEEKEIESREIVPGDLLVLKGGDVIPADSELIKANQIKADESALTGESKAVGKKVGDEVYKNTHLTVGEGLARVKKTGMETKIGEVATELEEMEEEKTPFYKEMNQLSKKLSWIILGIVLVVLVVSLIKYSFYESILTAVALAVAAIPEGLPAVITLSLALGAKVMMKKNALIRRLGVTESIGGVNVICSDKTGTITKDEMEVTKIYMDEEKEVGEMGEESKELILNARLNNNVTRRNNKLVGDQTEVALYKMAKKFKVKNYEELYEIPFTPERKMMTVVVENREKKVYSKGAPEVLVERCNKILKKGKVKRMTKKDRERILEKNKEFSSRALRVLGLAYKSIKSLPNKERDKKLERGLVWTGLTGISDPVRKGVKEAVDKCRKAGIRVIMITGDNPNTAKAVTKEINLETKGVLTGKEMENMEGREIWSKLVNGVNVFARVNPKQKLKIMEQLRKRDNVVAMTGDGVNDSLALKRADVGVSMGIKGTDVAKQASDLVLLDDNFVTIVKGVEEGRRIFDNARKFVNYLLTSNMAEVIVIFLATLLLTLKYPILLPVQLLWINLLTDGFPALALGVDPSRPDSMKRQPRDKEEGVLNKQLAYLIIAIGIVVTITLFATFFLTRYLYDIEVARTSLFTGFVLYELVRIGSIKYREGSSWLNNRWLLLAIAASLGLQLVIIYTPMNSLFKIVPLGLYHWLILIAGTVITYILAILATKLVAKRQRRESTI